LCKSGTGEGLLLCYGLL
nr:immunoglobulin heavy chain junction region [Mus musculus]